MSHHFSPTRILRRIRRFFEGESIDLLAFVGPAKRYSREKLRADLGAAPNVALLAIPQGIAYAAIAELPISFGIICSAVAAIVAPLFAGSRHTILGPTNATAFMLFSFFAAASPELAARETELVPLLVLLVGIFCMVGGFLKVADLLQYVSRSVLVGYLTGAAVLIMANQLKHILGVSHEVGEIAPRNFVSLLYALGSTITDTRWQPLLIGVCSALLYYGLNRWKPKWPNFAIALVLISSTFGILIHRGGPFSEAETFVTFTFADLVPTLPDFGSRQIFDDISSLIAVAFAVAFLACLENTVMAKTIASRSGDRAEVNQDMFSVGVANLASAFAGGMPASGSLTRSVLNYTSGALTRFSSIYGGIIILVAGLVIAWLPSFDIGLIDYVPKASLAALIVVVAMGIINPTNIRICLRSTPDDAVVLVTTFVSTLIAPLHVAIFIGVALSITLFLRRASKPHLVEYEFSDKGELREMGEKRKRPNPAISIVHVEGDLFFGAAELFRNQLQRTAADPSLHILILRLKNARHLDATSVLALEELIKFMRSDGRHVLISGAPREVYKVLKNSGVLTVVQEGADRSQGESNIFLYRPSNPNISTRDALKRAQQLLGGEKADIRIFYDPNKS